MKFRIMCAGIGAIPVRIDAFDGNIASAYIDKAEVGFRWDSTLNSKFDTKCVVSHAIPLTPSERGCIASHIHAWKLIARTADSPMISSCGSADWHIFEQIYGHCLPLRSRECEDRGKWWYIICEDDAAIVSRNIVHNFQYSLRRIVEALPTDCDICYLGHIIASAGIRKKSMYRLFLKPSYLWQMHAYMLTPNSAKRLLTHLPVNDPVDNFIARLIYEGKIEVNEFCDIVVEYIFIVYCRPTLLETNFLNSPPTYAKGD